MVPRAVLAIDQGTTGTTAIVFDQSGQVISRAYREFRQIYPQPLWVEHDPEEIWEVTIAAGREAIKKAPIANESIVSLGISNQRETTVVWNRRTGKPIYNAIVWQCRRTAKTCKRLLQDGHQDEVQKKTGLLLDPYFSATKLAWILDHVEGARERAKRGELAFGTIDSWLIYRLTGGKNHLTDYTNASRTLLFNIQKKDWDQDLLKLFEIPENVLPEVQESSSDFGFSTKEIFEHEIPIRGIAGDQQSALFGHDAWEIGHTKCTFGTGAFAVLYCGKNIVESKNKLLVTLACDQEGKPAYALEGSIFMAGATIQWLRDEMKLIDHPDETEAICQTLEGNDGVYLVPAFVGLGAPHWKPEIKAAIFGLTRGTGRAHVIRAAIESIAYQTWDLMEAMKKDTGKDLPFLKVDGGVVKNAFLNQFMADLLGIPIVRPKMVEITALGAAKLAVLKSDFWSNMNREEERFEPKQSPGKSQRLIREWTKAIQRLS